FYAFAPNDGVQQTEGYLHRFENQIFYDGRSNFTTLRDGYWGWFDGSKPSFQDSLQRACDVNFVAGCVYRSLTQEINYPGRKTSYSHQASAGVQHQLGLDMSVEVNSPSLEAGAKKARSRSI